MLSKHIIVTWIHFCHGGGGGGFEICWKKYFYENYKCHTVKQGNHRDKLSFGTQIFSLPMKIDNPLLSRIDSKIFLNFVFRIHGRTILDIFLSLSS